MYYELLISVKTPKIGERLSNMLQYLPLHGFIPGILYIRFRGGVTSSMGQAGTWCIGKDEHIF